MKEENILSFPRKWESSKIQNFWIPASAGMTTYILILFPDYLLLTIKLHYSKGEN